tara:strand:- start:347 stop:496 length:150 start_codon:yes stop_codon:yes gene_type:complete
MDYDCGNCGHHWNADKYQESCPKCQSWHVMTAEEWREQDDLDAILDMDI